MFCTYKNKSNASMALLTTGAIDPVSIAIHLALDGKSIYQRLHSLGLLTLRPLCLEII